MANLFEDDTETREAWLMYAIEFASRGLLPRGAIEAHGPHGTGISGSATCSDVRGFGWDVSFVACGARGTWDLRGFRAESRDRGERTTFPRLRLDDLPKGWRTMLREWRSERRRLRAEAELERAALRRAGNESSVRRT